VQYHPEYKSTVANPHPIFVNFVAAAVAKRNNFSTSKDSEI
jgi:CTP synthase